MNASGKARRALVVSATKQAFDLLAELLPDCGTDPPVYAATAGAAKRMLAASDFDMMIINTPLSDEFGTELALDFSARSMGILLLCKSDLFEQVAYRVESSGVLVLPRPVTRQMLFTAAHLLFAVTAKLSKLEQRNKTLQEKMEDIRVVNRAKWLLIENLGMNEKSAHYHIEKQAMDMRLTRREVAEHIIRTYDT